MTDLSPAAQAVLEASAERWAGTRTQAIAAALRAVANQLKYKLLGVEVVDCSQLRLLAAEIEAQ